MKTRYIASIFKNNRGHGLLSVHAESKKHAKAMADRIAGNHGTICRDVESFRAYERKVRRFAVDDFIWRNSRLMNPTRPRNRTNDTMKTKFDTTTVGLTPRFKAALIEVMKANCEMMAKAEPKYAECWTWGQCEVGDLASTNGLCFTYGGDDDRPKGSRFSIVLASRR